LLPLLAQVEANQTQLEELRDRIYQADSAQKVRSILAPPTGSI
jgi:hypothetical protein